MASDTSRTDAKRGPHWTKKNLTSIVGSAASDNARRANEPAPTEQQVDKRIRTRLRKIRATKDTSRSPRGADQGSSGPPQNFHIATDDEASEQREAGRIRVGNTRARAMEQRHSPRCLCSQLDVTSIIMNGLVVVVEKTFVWASLTQQRLRRITALRKYLRTLPNLHREPFK